MNSNKSKTSCKQGFTLIELLVVVLIIGILAAVAVPQYQKAVEKSRAAEAISLLKSVYQAAQTYYLANGQWPDSIRQLDIDIPWTGNTNWRTNGNDFKQGISNQDWSVQLIKIRDNVGKKGVSIGRISGKYQGTGFQIFQNSLSANIPVSEILCVERGIDTYIVAPISDINQHYCTSILNGKLILYGSSFYYKLP